MIKSINLVKMIKHSILNNEIIIMIFIVIIPLALFMPFNEVIFNEKLFDNILLRYLIMTIFFLFNLAIFGYFFLESKSSQGKFKVVFFILFLLVIAFVGKETYHSMYSYEKYLKMMSTFAFSVALAVAGVIGKLISVFAHRP